jgi:hypothetical protein
VANAATQQANASPEKRLFIFLLTRDITLTDAFHDLIDNSINSAIIGRKLKLDQPQDYVNLLQASHPKKLPQVRISFCADQIEVSDDAGGIRFSDALTDVFRFGREADDEPSEDRLSVYGIGLKRAIFKMGNQIHIRSNHLEMGFEMDLTVSEWERDRSPNWTMPISEYKSESEPFGTRIRITDLRSDVKSRLSDPGFAGELIGRIQETYVYFLNAVVEMSVAHDSEEKEIDPIDIGLGENFSNDNFEENGVSCRIVAGIARTRADRYLHENAGWYVFCNGRAVTHADKTELTGWGTPLLPIFQPKHRPFLGLVFFVSQNPELLPWTTTKTHINEESLVWQNARRRMSAIGRSVISFLDKRYTDDGTEVPPESLKEIAGKEVRLFASVSEIPKSFAAVQEKPSESVVIRYTAKRTEVGKIKQYVGRRSMTNPQVGRYTFDYFLKNEVGD